MDGCIRCEGIGVGGVPSVEDMEKLNQEGVRTLIDAREDGEGGPDIAETAAQQGFRYIRVPISHSKVDMDQVETFRSAVSDPANGKVYAFSSNGKRPAGMLCFLACAKSGDSVIEVFHKARRNGFSLEKEDGLKKFILDFYSSHRGDIFNNYYFQHPRHV